jgi:hypothetical protein
MEIANSTKEGGGEVGFVFKLGTGDYVEIGCDARHHVEITPFADDVYT